MEVDTLDMPALLAELGANYDPDRLADAMRSRPWELRKRALRIATTLGTFFTSLLQVGWRVPPANTRLVDHEYPLTPSLVRLIARPRQDQTHLAHRLLLTAPHLPHQALNPNALSKP